MALTKLSTDVIDLSGNTEALTIPKGTSNSTLGVEYLVVAGGGGGGAAFGGGGGAGGLLTATADFATGSPLDLTIGAGGGGGVGGATNGKGTDGSDSIFSSITSTGGGAGASYFPTNGSDSVGNNGGSGGGGATNESLGNWFAGGTGSQGYNGGSGKGGQPYCSGGGGGAGAVGADSGSTFAGDGGVGLQNTITGASPTPYYAGGGGGGAYTWDNSSTPGSGGTGGGGAGVGGNSQNGNAGTVNTGGGGGGGGYASGSGGSGGSGVVILRYPTANPITISAGLTSSTPIIIGTDTVVIFTAGTGTVSFAGTGTGRPSSPTEGLMRENTTTSKMEFYDGSLWQEITDTANTYVSGLIPSANFQTVIWPGNSTARRISLSFQPDIVWVKKRSSATSSDHCLVDSVRGPSTNLNILYPNLDIAESTGVGSNYVESLDTDGFDIGTSTYFNATSETYVAWSWKAGGTATTITAGTEGNTIASDVSANVAAGFSIVKYTGNSTSGATISHGLGGIPELAFFKNLPNTAGNYNWTVYSGPNGPTGLLYLNDSYAFTTTSSRFNDTSPTDTVFTLGNDDTINKTGESNIAYCWKSIPGYSKIGFYVGTGVATGPKIYTGFDTCWVMIKRTDAVSNWNIYDNKRDPSNPSGPPLYPNLNNAEAGSQAINLLSDGFQPDWPSGGTGDVNVLGGTYIYMAFAQ